jgi:PadR family transcriptional regulator PadR
MFRDTKIRTQALRVLARQPDHGYGIAQQIIARAKGLLDGQESLLYPALYELESDDIIESYITIENGETERYYRLTGKGKGLVARDENRNSESVRSDVLTLGET